MLAVPGSEPGNMMTYSSVAEYEFRGEKAHFGPKRDVLLLCARMLFKLIHFARRGRVGEVHRLPGHPSVGGETGRLQVQC